MKEPSPYLDIRPLLSVIKPLQKLRRLPRTSTLGLCLDQSPLSPLHKAGLENDQRLSISHPNPPLSTNRTQPRDKADTPTLKQ
jgi:hypothetical protein